MKKIMKVLEKNWVYLAVLILGIGCRLAFIGEYPVGLQQDEASAGYEAFSLLTTGLDRNGISWPIHFISWGSGQNALYSYLCMPLIAIFGLNVVVVRLPMALFGCLSLVLFYEILKRGFGKEKALLGMFLLAINPWHIVKSRWSIESNIFPELMILATFLFIVGFEKEGKTRQKYLTGAAFVASLSLYSYGTAYCFVPIFLGLVLGYLLWQKKIQGKEVILPGTVFVVTAIPIGLFVLINTFNLPQIEIGMITIPKLLESRHTQMSAVFSADAGFVMWENLKDSIKILLFQRDEFAEHGVKGFGLFYLYSLPIMMYGAWKSFFHKNWKIEEVLFHGWAVAAGFMMIMVTPNITRLNSCWFAFVYFLAIGCFGLWDKSKKLRKPLLAVYGISFVLFIGVYFTSYQEKLEKPFVYDLEEIFVYCEENEIETLRMSEEITEPYIYYLFYKEVDPNVFRETVEYQGQSLAFRQVGSFEGFIKEVPMAIEDSEAAYIMTIDMATQIDTSGCTVKNFGAYCLIQKVEE